MPSASLILPRVVSATAGGVRDVETLKKQAMRSLAGGVRGGEL